MRRVLRAAKRGHVLMAAVAALLLVPVASAAAAPPLNDAFSAPETIEGTSATVAGTAAEATKEAGEPDHAGYVGGKSVWYAWEAPDDGIAVIAPKTSGMLIGVYTGTAVGDLEPVGTGRVAPARFAVTAGTTYRIAIEGQYATNPFSFTLEAGSAPANDDFAEAAVLSGTSATATGDTRFASREAGEPAPAYGSSASVWWTWTAPSTGGVTISTAGTSFDAALGVYTGEAVDKLSYVVANNGSTKPIRTTFRAVEGTTYRIAVDGSNSARGAVALSLELQPPPSNDTFATALDLGSPETGTVAGSTLGASGQIGEPGHTTWSTTANASVWYSWTAPKDGSLTLRADGSHTRNVAVYTGSSVDALTRLAAQAQASNPGSHQVRVRVDAGVTYRIAVDGYPTYAGSFDLSLTLIDRPANDDFEDATVLEGTSADVVGTNVGATQELGEPIHEENYYDPSVWYSWTAPSTGGVKIDTAGSTFDTVVAAYTGEAVNKLTRVASTRIGTSAQEKRTFRAVAGTTYRIAVDGRGARTGAIKLSLRFSPPPANDAFAAAQALDGSDVTVAGDNTGATAETGEPADGGESSVWYRWTAPGDGRVSVSLPETEVSHSFRTWKGSSLGGLSRASADYPGYFAVTGGTTYRIEVNGGWAGRRGTFKLRVQYTPPPANDDFAQAPALDGMTPTASGTNAGATHEAGEPERHCCYGHGDQSVWWRWTAPDDGRATIDLAGTSFEWAAGVYTGTSVGSLAKVADGSGRSIAFRAIKGRTYRIAIDSLWDDYHSDRTGAINLALTLVPGPANDDLADAKPLGGSAADTTGRTLNATGEASEPDHSSRASAVASVWHRWRAPASGPVTFTVAPSAGSSGFAPLVRAYTGTSVGALTAVADSRPDDAVVAFDAEAGQVYRIAVDGSTNTRGAYALSLRHGTPPANDAFGAAQELTGATAGVQGTNVYARQEAGEPDHAGDKGGASIWYRWTAPSYGSLRVSTAGSAIDTVLGVYTGGSVGGLTTMGSTSGDEVRVDVVAGETYRIAVDGTNDGDGPVQGATNLQLELTEGEAPPPAPVTRGADPAEVAAAAGPRTTQQGPDAKRQQEAGPLALTATVTRRRLGTVLKRGLSGRATCSSACSLEIAVTVARKGAKAGAASTATARTAAAGSFRVTLSKAAKRALRKARSAKLTVVVTARGEAGTATVTRRLTVRR